MRIVEAKEGHKIGHWFFGPSVIGMSALLKKLDSNAPSLSSGSAHNLWHDVDEVIDPAKLNRANRILQAGYTAIKMGRFWQQYSFMEAPTVWTLCAAATSPSEILKTGAQMALLDSNSYAIGVRRDFETLRVSIYPLAAMPAWQHVMLLQQLALGVTSMLGLKQAVHSVTFDNQVITKAQLLELKPKHVTLQSASQVAFNLKALSSENPFASPGWDLITRSIVNPLVGMRLKQQCTAYKVARAIIESYSAGSALDMVSIADLLHLEKSTLRRKLKADGTAFSKLLSQFRRQEVRLRLSAGDAQQEITQALGYDSLVSLKRLLKTVM